ncbi:hypothetical protein MRX96_014337 [Rhipicephalus microplus]
MVRALCCHCKDESPLESLLRIGVNHVMPHCLLVLVTNSVLQGPISSWDCPNKFTSKRSVSKNHISPCFAVSSLPWLHYEYDHERNKADDNTDKLGKRTSSMTIAYDQRSYYVTGTITPPAATGLGYTNPDRTSG